MISLIFILILFLSVIVLIYFISPHLYFQLWLLLTLPRPMLNAIISPIPFISISFAFLQLSLLASLQGIIELLKYFYCLLIASQSDQFQGPSLQFFFFLNIDN